MNEHRSTYPSSSSFHFLTDFQRSQKMFILSLFLFLSFNLTYSYQPYNDTDPDYATSVHHLRQLVLTELSLLPKIFSAFEVGLNNGAHKDMGTYIYDFTSSNMTLEEDNSLNSLKSFISRVTKEKVDVERIADETVKHPLKSYRTIRRFVRFINNFDKLEIANNEDLIETIGETKQIIKFPKEGDVNVSMQNILRLRQIFRFSVKDLIEGQLQELKTGSGLTVQQLIEIAEHSMTMKMYTHAVDFYDGAVKRCEHFQQDFIDCSALDFKNINETLNLIIKWHDQLVYGSGFDHNDPDLVPPDSSPFVFDTPLKNISSEYFANRRFLQVDRELETFLSKKNISTDDINLAISPFLFEKICRGEVKQVGRNSSFKCFYLKSHPFYKISPLKAEVHSDSPYLLQIYDFLSENEILELKKEVGDELRQSRTTATGGDDLGQTSRFRTSANAWIEDDSNEKFKYLNKRIGLITGLNTTGYYSTEIVQIAAYNPGGHYTPHSDALFEKVILERFPESELERGDRIMTFMAYLSDVEKGGGTGFPTLQTLVQPVKGSAVLWYNLNSDGNINYNVVHGGCPVLYGTKWIANKWIRSNDQMFLKKCPKNKKGWKIKTS